jgi:hypothetical protein
MYSQVQRKYMGRESADKFGAGFRLKLESGNRPEHGIHIENGRCTHSEEEEELALP